MANEAITIIEVDPMPTITDAVGGGAQLPIVLTFTSDSSNEIGDMGVPPDTDVIVELWGAGGGGAGSPVGASPGGGGGGGGGYIMVRVPAAVWALGGTIDVPGNSAGGAATANGTLGGDCQLNITGLDPVEASGGTGGTSTGGSGGAGGGTLTIPEVETIMRVIGTSGSVSVSAVGGAGGAAAGPIRATGGAGGTGTSGAGGNGGDPGAGGGGGAATVGVGGIGARGQARVTFNLA